jgi:cell division protease FtsH
MAHDRPYSDDTAKEIDTEVAALINEAARRAEIVIENNRAGLDKLSKALLAEETIEEDKVIEILKDAILPKEAKLY